MDKLVTDIFSRRVAQILIAAIFGLVSLAPFVLLLILWMQQNGWLGTEGGGKGVAKLFISILALPIEDSAAQVGGAFVAVLPGIVAAVCYIVVKGSDGITNQASKDLTLFGQISVVCLIAGAVGSLLAVVLLGSHPDWVANVTDVSADADKLTPLLKGVFGGLLAFDILYITTLLGIQNAPAS